MERRNLIDFFRDYFDSSREFLIYDDGYRRWVYSFRDVARRAAIFQQQLRRNGIGPGDKVVLWSENRPEWIFAFWGSMLAEAVVVPMGSEAPADFVDRVCDIVRPGAIVLGEDVRPENRGSKITTWRLATSDWSGPAPRVELPQTNTSDLAEIVFTSGSTGTPKGVKLTHGNLLSQVEAVEPVALRYRKLARLVPRLRMLQMLPLSHMFGQSTTLLLPPMIPCSVMMMRQQTPAAVLEQIRARRISAAVCVPRVLELLGKLITKAIPDCQHAAHDTSTLLHRLWRYRRVHRLLGWQFGGFMVGGAALDRELEDFWANLGYLIVQGYGLTETSPVVTINHPLRPRRGSVGRTLPGVEIRIAEDREILVRGPNVMPGYYDEPQKTAETLKHGWLHTGDLGEVDDGVLYIRGRKKEVIVTPEGQNIFPDDVERVLDAQNGVRESAVIGIPSQQDESQEQVHAVLVLEDGTDPQSVVDAANRELHAGQRIRDFSLWSEGELPRTEGTRKVKRRAIRDRIMSEREKQPEPGETRPSEAGCRPELVRTELQRRTRREVSEQTRVDELGLSSIDQVELLLELEQQCQVVADETEFADAETIGDLEKMVERMLSDEAHQFAIGRGAIRFPEWNRKWPARAVRRANLSIWILPFTQLTARPTVTGLEHLNRVKPPVLFASNHLSNLDTPVILAALPDQWRYRIAPAIYKERFRPHFFPQEHSIRQRIRNSIDYYLIALLFNAFPIPQREPGARQTLRYAGDLVSDGWSLLIFPEGRRRPGEQISEFMPGVGLLASRLSLPVVPIHLRHVDQVLPPGRLIPRLGATQVSFGPPIAVSEPQPERLTQQVEEAVKAL